MSIQLECIYKLELALELEAVLLHMKFVTFGIRYIFRRYLPPKPKKSTTELELKKPLALSPHS